MLFSINFCFLFFSFFFLIVKLFFHLISWLQDPPRLQRELCPVTGHKKRPHSDKFRVTLDVTGYKPEDLSVKVVGRKLFIDGKQEFRDGTIFEIILLKKIRFHMDFQFLGEDFSLKEMRKTYDLPENASFEHMTSFLTAKGFHKNFLRII